MIPEHPSDPEPTVLELTSGPIYYVDEGAGPPVVMIHGLPGSNRDFRWLAPALEGVRSIRLDLPGFGASPVRTGRSPLLFHRAHVVASFVEALDLRNVVLLGHSFGGPLAVAAAHRLGNRALGIALLASVGIRPHRAKRRGFSAWRTLSFSLLVPPMRARLLPRIRDAYFRAGFSRSTSDEAFVRTVHQIAWTSIPRHGSNVRRLKCPTFVAWSLDDPLVEAEISEELAAACPEGPRLSFATGGHNLQKTRAVEIGEALSEWMPTLKTSSF